MTFSKTFLEEVKERNDIEEVINRYVPLKRAGANMVGLCPFHSEKTPSFTVFSASKSFYCFGCQTGGDVVSFVMRMEGMDYPEAVEFLANRAGVPIQEENGYSPPAVRVKKERIVEAMREAGRFYHSRLFTEKGKTALEYVKKRDITNLTVKRFGIGFAPDGWDNLYTHLKEKGFTDDEMKAAFLVGVSKNNTYFDIFRNRLMFPVFDLTGNPVAFSARRLNENDERKYINTSDTPAFKKSKILFGLNIAKNSSEGSLILCEGAVDAVMLHQAGFSNACATLGTSITDDHARIISRIAKTVYLAYDIDKAGRLATEKAISKLNQVGVAVKIINLGDETKDPDEFIKKYGADAFRRRLTGSEGQTEYLINQILSKYALNLPDEKAMAAREVCAYLATINSGTELEIYASSAAAKLGVGKEVLLEDIKRQQRISTRSEKKKFAEKALSEIQGFGDRTNKDKVRFLAAATIEEKILGIILSRPDLGPYACQKLTGDHFITEFNKRVFEFFLEDFKGGKQPDISREGYFSQNEISAIVKTMAQREGVDDNSQKVLDEYIEKLKRQKEIREGEEKIKENPLEGLTDYIEQLRKRKK